MDWHSFWDLVWGLILIFVFVAYLILLFMILTDLFRDHTLKAGWKVVWIIFLIIFPYITAFVYLLARGPGMAERQRAASAATEKATQEYIRQAAGTSGPADQIATAKALLDDGTITQQEYDQLKAKALS
ncbi:SHOCT domain-containing protein [Gordonia jinhuaensis]|uniref:Membrane protein n=1 Tax=Gordonia jinhuaensis TaxID=1517702 RepID=A0A916X0X0_9ACTN|nr:SHOCT domain-containing protein [Gordonia jinhuaensis]GGB44923.1 membrane protein [Gordonia jinhuaensis]